jgi:hypothetical protein
MVAPNATTNKTISYICQRCHDKKAKYRVTILAKRVGDPKYCCGRDLNAMLEEMEHRAFVVRKVE